MNGFTWVRIDRTADRTAPLKKLARGCGKDEVWALGLLVRTKLTYATRFPAGVADLTPDDLALELDVDEVAVQQLLAQGYLQQQADGLARIVRETVRLLGLDPADPRVTAAFEEAVSAVTTGRKTRVSRVKAQVKAIEGQVVEHATTP